jgi:hypothetical protein
MTSFRDAPKFKYEPNTIYLAIFSDAFCCSDGLSPKSKALSFIGVYFKILNLPQQYMSRRNDIPAIIFGPSIIEVLRDYFSLFDQLREELSYLTFNGLNITRKNGLSHQNIQINIKVKLHAIVGDNKFQSIFYGLTSQFT